MSRILIVDDDREIITPTESTPIQITERKIQSDSRIMEKSYKISAWHNNGCVIQEDES